MAQALSPAKQRDAWVTPGLLLDRAPPLPENYSAARLSAHFAQPVPTSSLTIEYKSTRLTTPEPIWLALPRQMHRRDRPAQRLRSARSAVIL
jgi:hypothetical protein